MSTEKIKERRVLVHGKFKGTVVGSRNRLGHGFCYIVEFDQPGGPLGSNFGPQYVRVKDAKPLDEREVANGN